MSREGFFHIKGARDIPIERYYRSWAAALEFAPSEGDLLDRFCPYCFAKAGEPCLTDKGQKVGYFHGARKTGVVSQETLRRFGRQPRTPK
jgi:hypothetical protein